MIVGQLSDLHLLEGGLLVGPDPFAAAERAIAGMNELSPDVVLVTGDVLGGPERRTYQAARRLLDGLSAPYHVVPGNHDLRKPLVEAFGDHAPLDGDGFVQYVVDEHPLRLVALDTLREGSQDGELCERRLGWLRAKLGESEHPTLLFMHHPPIASGIGWIDSAGLVGRTAFAEVVAETRHVVGVVCGHVHRAFSGVCGGVPVSVAPSTVFEISLELRRQGPRCVRFGAPAISVHVFDGAAITTHVQVLDGAREIDLSAFDAHLAER